MEIRKRTRQGVSKKLEVSEPLRVVARSRDSVTLSFEVSFHETSFNINLSYLEAQELVKDLRTNGGE